MWQTAYSLILDHGLKKLTQNRVRALWLVHRSSKRGSDILGGTMQVNERKRTEDIGSLAKLKPRRTSTLFVPSIYIFSLVNNKLQKGEYWLPLISKIIVIFEVMMIMALKWLKFHHLDDSGLSSEFWNSIIRLIYTAKATRPWQVCCHYVFIWSFVQFQLNQPKLNVTGVHLTSCSLFSKEYLSRNQSNLHVNCPGISLDHVSWDPACLATAWSRTLPRDGKYTFDGLSGK